VYSVTSFETVGLYVQLMNTRLMEYSTQQRMFIPLEYNKYSLLFNYALSDAEERYCVMRSGRQTIFQIFLLLFCLFWLF
jgi:hypothetical protein